MKNGRAARRKRNPWLKISAADYLGHMGSPEVDQLSVLARILRDSLRRHRPRTLLVLGCATGNGFEHIDPAVTRRVTGVDINAEYLERLRQSFPRPEFECILHCQDVAECALPKGEFDLIHCALILEYVEWRRLLPRLAEALAPGATLSIVLQRPSNSVPAVTPSAFPSLRRLESVFQFVDVEALLRAARVLGLQTRERREVQAKQGKKFLLLELRHGAFALPSSLRTARRSRSSSSPRDERQSRRGHNHSL